MKNSLSWLAASGAPDCRWHNKSCSSENICQEPLLMFQKKRRTNKRERERRHSSTPPSRARRIVQIMHSQEDFVYIWMCVHVLNCYYYFRIHISLSLREQQPLESMQLRRLSNEILHGSINKTSRKKRCKIIHKCVCAAVGVLSLVGWLALAQPCISFSHQHSAEPWECIYKRIRETGCANAC